MRGAADDTIIAHQITRDVLSGQIAGSLPEGATPDNTIIAYEPVWAIATGTTPTPEEIATTHAFIRTRLLDPDIAILYGGLVGGASLAPQAFIPVIQALETST